MDRCTISWTFPSHNPLDHWMKLIIQPNFGGDYHSFAIRHVCNFFTSTHTIYSFGTTFSSSPLRCMRFTLFTRLLIPWAHSSCFHWLIESVPFFRWFFRKTRFTNRTQSTPQAYVSFGKTKPRRKPLCFTSKKAIHDPLIHERRKPKRWKKLQPERTHSLTMSRKPSGGISSIATRKPSGGLDRKPLGGTTLGPLKQLTGTARLLCLCPNLKHSGDFLESSVASPLSRVHREMAAILVSSMAVCSF